MKRSALLLLLLIVACGKSAAHRREDVLECSERHKQANLIALCLITDHKWPDAEANAAGRAREREIDSTTAWQEDSLWRVEARQHRQELRQCPGRWPDMTSCLQAAGWSRERAQRTADSIWAVDWPEHQRQIRSCLARERTANIAACLQLYYRWTSDRALKANDSVRYQRVR